MKNHSEIQEKIIQATITLIQESDGLIENISMRAIAHEAGVAVGLINYHFESKKNLIELCVQRIIYQVMRTFPDDANKEFAESGKEDNRSEMTSFIIRVFSFLISHPEISKISMLGDFSEPNVKSNSSVSYRAILKSLSDKKEPETIEMVKAFMLLATIQSAFLNREISEKLFAFNLNEKDDYGHFFQLVTSILAI